MLSPEEPDSSSSMACVVDPLLKELSEKKETFRRNVESLAAELEAARLRLASHDRALTEEAIRRQEAETRVKIMEKEMEVLNKSLDERIFEIHASESTAQMVFEELGSLRLQLSKAMALARASGEYVESAVLRCSVLFKELEDKNFCFKENEAYVDELGEDLYRMHSDGCARESELKDEVSKTERRMMQALAEARVDKDNKLRKIFDEVIIKRFVKIDKRLKMQDEEIAKLKDEVMAMAVHLELETREMEAQLEKHNQKNQELKRKVLKIDFSLQEVRAQARKLKRKEDHRNKAFEEIKDQFTALQQLKAISEKCRNRSFWERSGFKIAISVSVIVIVLFSRR